MKISYSNRTIAIALLMVAGAGLMIDAGPTVGLAQGRRARDRSNRDARSAEPNPLQRDAVQTASSSGAATESVAGAGAAQSQDRWATYNIILQRNIFSRQRIPPRPAGEAEAQAVAPDPETYFVLRGVVQQNNEFIAFIEDTQSGRVLQLRRNDSVARGVIKSLNLDSVEYQFDDKTTTVQMGSDLQGGRGAVITDEMSDWPQTSVPAAQPGGTAPPQTPSSDESDIIKRLMEQRRQQLGQ
jgi:hypothetical protein